MIRLASNRTGLGSRLKCLLSVMRLAEMCGDDYGIVYEKNKNARCRWGHLFENDIEVHKTREDLDGVKYPEVYYGWRWKATEDEKKKYAQKTFDFMYAKTPFKAGILRQIEKLIPLEFIRNTVVEYKSLIDSNTLAVCARSWKDVKGTHLERNFYADELYSAIEINYTGNIFLATDDAEIYKKLCKRYGKKNVNTYNNRTYWGDRKSARGMQDALIEMLLPGNANKMILTWHSAYNECQWWFGGGKADVIEVSKWKEA